MTPKNIEKIKKFYEVVSRLQPAATKEIGLLVVKKETLADISNLAPDLNMVTSFELTPNKDAETQIDWLYEAMKNKRWAIIRLHEYLDPKIYNQLYLISHDKRMQFSKLEDWVTLDIPEESNIIIVSTDKELEKLNYNNFFSLVGPVERL